MKRITISLLFLIAILFYGCESATSTVGNGNVDTLYINEGDKITWGLKIESNDSSIDKSHINLTCNGDYDEIPQVYFNGQPAKLNDWWMGVVDGLEFLSDTFASGETVTFRTIYLDDTLEGSVVIPPRLVSLRCNDIIVSDTAKDNYKGNKVILNKEAESFTLSWELPAGYSSVYAYGHIAYSSSTGDYSEYWFDDSEIKGNSLIISLSDLGATEFSSSGYLFLSLSDTEKLKMGDKPNFSSKYQNVYAQLFSPSWDIDFDFQ